MSTEQNKAVVRRFVDEVLNGRDLAVLDELAVQDHVEHNAPPGVEPGVEGLRMGLRQFFSAFPDFHSTVERQIAEGDYVATTYTNRGTHQGDLFGIPATGRAVAYTTMDVIRLQDGKIAERWSMDDNLTRLRQLGLMPDQKRE
jgi:steroid delta-isomerase-like uncharacterized protein